MVIRIGLVNMPFADWRRPSFALSQLAALTRQEFQDEVDVSVRYLNQDFVSYFGAEAYAELSQDVEHFTSGVGGWLFRDVAFPDSPDNTEEYFRRYHRRDHWQDFREYLVDRRRGIADFCAQLVERHHLDAMDVVGFTSRFTRNTASIALARLVRLPRRTRLGVREVRAGHSTARPPAAAVGRPPDPLRPLQPLFHGPGRVRPAAPAAGLLPARLRAVP
ncbi:hypothetical protein [Kitasatospora sp. McL0602]|uniref:hypothetical protein n=1 Tax=Kitasatospora sp. McL0602 TaxID=3439530 RepID=UPI003F89B539